MLESAKPVPWLRLCLDHGALGNNSLARFAAFAETCKLPGPIVSESFLFGPYRRAWVVEHCGDFCGDPTCISENPSTTHDIPVQVPI